MYRLLGKNVSHSYSQDVYKHLGHDYKIMDLKEEKFDKFIQEKNFKGLNITMPYKKRVIKFLDNIDEIAQKLGVINTVINKDGRLFGFNNDYYGLKYLINKNQIQVSGKKILVLGSGATADTAEAVLKDLKAHTITKVSRKKKKNVLTYDEISRAHSYDVIINTTPVGMYPNSNETPLDLNLFTKLEAVIDVIYNPLKTKLIIQAEKLQIPAVGGLEMLVAQAVQSARLFFNETIEDYRIDEIYKKIKLEKINLVLIGMPTSGKTTIGKLLAKQLNKTFLDIDDIIVTQENKTINQIFQEEGEPFFRSLESKVISNLSNKANCVIASGGGSILKTENIARLKQNGILIFIDRKLDLLITDKSRPLSANYKDLKKLYKKRYQIYTDVSDLRVLNNQSLKKVVFEIIEAIKCEF